MTIDEYFGAQKNNLTSSLAWEPFASIFPLVDKLYAGAIELLPGDRPPIFGQLLLVCHKSFLSAAALIGQAQPEDAGPITRRAIEAAHYAAVVRTSPEKASEWNAFEKRMQRWADRREGKKPKPLQIKLGDVHSGIKPTIERLMAMLGVISDADVHFTPEFMTQLAWDKRDGSIYLSYFTKDSKELERAIILTSSAHLGILEVIDWCLDGIFKSNSDWFKIVDEFKKTVEPRAKKFANQ